MGVPRLADPVHLAALHHFGWAHVVGVRGREVVLRTRIDLVEPGVEAAPVHAHAGVHRFHDDGRPPMSDEQLAELVASVEASTRRAVRAAFDDLTTAVGASEASPIASLSLRRGPAHLPGDVATLRSAAWEARADSARYLAVMSDEAIERGWAVHRFDPTRALVDVGSILGPDHEDALAAPRATWGAPWTAEHRAGYAAALLAAHDD